MTLDIATLRNRLHEMLPELQAKYGVTELGIFGSRLRGDNRPDSDLDVLVSFKPEQRLSLFDLAQMEIDIEERLGVKVDLVERECLKKYMKPYILREVEYV